MSFIKFLKIGLPITTVTSATIFTSLLVSSSQKKEINNLENLDSALNDFQLPDEKFKDEQKFYTKEEEDKAPEEVNEETKQKINELLDNLGESKSAEELAQKMKNFEKDVEKLINQKANEAKSEIPSKGKGDQSNNDLQEPSKVLDSSRDETNGELPKAQEDSEKKIPEAISQDEFREVLTSLGEGDYTAVQHLEAELGSPKPEMEESASEAPQLMNSSPETSDKLDMQESSEPSALLNKEESVQSQAGEDAPSADGGGAQENLKSELVEDQDSTRDHEASSINTQNEESLSGKKQLTQEEIERSEELGNQLSSVSESLKNLYN